jgi:hypothetical protein
LDETTRELIKVGLLELEFNWFWEYLGFIPENVEFNDKGSCEGGEFWIGIWLFFDKFLGNLLVREKGDWETEKIGGKIKDDWSRKIKRTRKKVDFRKWVIRVKFNYLRRH